MRTVVAAEDASKEKILAALRQRRVYASRVPGLGIAFSLTNESSKTVIMGGDMEKQGILRLDFSAALPSSSVDSITDVALYAYKFGVTKETQKLIIYSTTESGAISNTPFVSNYTLTPEWLYEADYMYAIVKSVNCPDYAAVTSPIWFIA
jgi:hypothetical protein